MENRSTASGPFSLPAFFHNLRSRLYVQSGSRYQSAWTPSCASLRIDRALRRRSCRYLVGGRSLPRDAHRHALDNLDEVAGGIVGWKEGEGGAGAAGEAD